MIMTDSCGSVHGIPDHLSAVSRLSNWVIISVRTIIKVSVLPHVYRLLSYSWPGKHSHVLLLEQIAHIEEQNGESVHARLCIAGRK